MGPGGHSDSTGLGGHEDLREFQGQREMVCLWALGAVNKITSPSPGAAQRASGWGNGRCQVTADQIYLLAHMGLSLGTPETV